MDRKSCWAAKPEEAWGLEMGTERAQCFPRSLPIFPGVCFSLFCSCVEKAQTSVNVLNMWSCAKWMNGCTILGYFLFTTQEDELHACCFSAFRSEISSPVPLTIMSFWYNNLLFITNIKIIIHVTLIGSARKLAILDSKIGFSYSIFHESIGSISISPLLNSDNQEVCRK